MIQSHYNRRKKRQARLGRAWCFGCDAYLVAAGQKCPVCGRRHGIRREKKPY